MKISIVLGTRPEIIKMSPIIRECQKLNFDFFTIHTGQHYSQNLDKIFFEQLELPPPRYNLEVGSDNNVVQTAKIMMGVDSLLSKENPSVVLVEGDTNSVMGGALAAVKRQIKVGHVEAGLRSYDRTMPEEINRIVTDHCSEYLFAPTGISKKILESEGIPPNRVFVTGNTVVDTLIQNVAICERFPDIFTKFGVAPDDYFLVTVHRQDNVDNYSKLRNIINSLNMVSDRFEIPILYPIHPRSKKMMDLHNISPGNVRLLEPLDYFSFLNLEKNAKLILTDSGGIQEEACVLRVPCVTLRNNTERPETIDVGANMLAGTEPEKILECVYMMLQKNKNWDNPFGDGKAAGKIVKILCDHLT